VQDAFMQWWYGHNAVAFFLTTPFLGLMYYFLPKAADRPVFSYRLSIIHFWSLVFIYIWAGPHHLHYTATARVGLDAGHALLLMLWMPSWGGMINGLLTLRGAWHKVATDPVLKFFVVGITFYGMSTFEGPMLSRQERQRPEPLHRLDHRPRARRRARLERVHGLRHDVLAAAAALPDQALEQEAGQVHFWIGTIGILLYILPIYVAGITQGLMWRAIDDSGRCLPDFVETVHVGSCPSTGSASSAACSTSPASSRRRGQLLHDLAVRPATYDPPVPRPRRSKHYTDPPRPESAACPTRLNLGPQGSTSGCRATGTASGSACRSASRSGDAIAVIAPRCSRSSRRS
jgi:cytochrome c oxidase cbb3-type subunit I/II